MELLHQANIAIHVAAGLMALTVGLVLLTRRKGDAAHRFWGRIAALLFATVVASATAGLTLFRPDPTLGAVTLLSGYLLFSGWRAILSRGKSPTALDILVSVASIVGGAAMAWHLSTGAATFWKPQVVLPITGSLLFWGLYDLARLVWPAAWRRRLWRLEHGVKLILALSALAAAGAGTALPQYAPWSQVGPSILATLYVLFYVARHGRRQLAPA
jgi:uncharacterized membrane protein